MPKDTHRSWSVVLLLAVTFANSPAAGDWYDNLSTSVRGGKASFDFRLRSEIADLASFAEDARASTLISRWRSRHLND